MMAANLEDIMDQIGVALSQIHGLNWFDYPPKSAQAPFAFCDFPETLVFDGAMRRGMDRVTINVVVGVSSQVDKSSRSLLAAYGASTGPKSIKDYIDRAEIGQSCRVVSVEFGMIALASGVFSGATFTLDIAA